MLPKKIYLSILLLLFPAISLAQLGMSEQEYQDKYITKKPYSYEETLSFLPYVTINTYKSEFGEIMVAFLNDKAVRIQYRKLSRTCGSIRFCQNEFLQILEENKRDKLKWQRSRKLLYFNQREDSVGMSQDGQTIIFDSREAAQFEYSLQ